MWEGSLENLYQQIGSYQLFGKRSVQEHFMPAIGIASDRIDEMKRSKDQKLSTLNLLTLRTIYKFFQSHFPGPYRLFWRICLQNLVFEISCVGEDLAGFQKLLFWTPDITPQPSPVLVFHAIFVKPKTASREPWTVHSDRRDFKCKICGKLFKTKSNLVDHLRIHENKRELKCTICGKAFNTRRNLARHQLVHQTMRNFECQECGKSFKTDYELQRHLVIHSDKRDFKCDTCKKAFKRLRDLKRHKLIHAKRKPLNVQNVERFISESIIWININWHTRQLRIFFLWFMRLWEQCKRLPKRTYSQSCHQQKEDLQELKSIINFERY